MRNNQKILVVDDDSEIRSLLGRYLKDQGYRVTTAEGRRSLEKGIADFRPDLIVLDIMLSDGSGLDICREMRVSGDKTPVILLTALKEEVDRIIGLEIGADDYLGKPFSPRELVARIRAVLRRADIDAGEITVREYRFADFVADPLQRRVNDGNGYEIELTGAEFDLLSAFLDRPGHVLSRDRLLDLTRGRDRGPFDRSIDVLVSRLRRKFGDTTPPSMFKTVRNGGYLLALPVEKVEGAGR